MAEPKTTDRRTHREVEAVRKAISAWESQTSMEFSTDGLEAACWAFHEHMRGTEHGSE